MTSSTKVFEKEPIDFDPQVHVAAAYIEVEGKILFLQSSEGKGKAKQWGVPGGKLEAKESPEAAMRRELYEETGISLEDGALVHALGQLFIRQPEIDYVFHIFRVDLNHTPKISLSEEHLVYTWVSVEEARNLHLIEGAEEALNYVVKYSRICERCSRIHRSQ